MDLKKLEKDLILYFLQMGYTKAYAKKYAKQYAKEYKKALPM